MVFERNARKKTGRKIVRLNLDELGIKEGKIPVFPITVTVLLI
jgi:hypothetical protein